MVQRNTFEGKVDGRFPAMRCRPVSFRARLPPGADLTPSSIRSVPDCEVRSRTELEGAHHELPPEPYPLAPDFLHNAWAADPTVVDGISQTGFLGKPVSLQRKD